VDLILEFQAQSAPIKKELENPFSIAHANRLECE
jgi:hypothetical protein